MTVTILCSHFKYKSWYQSKKGSYHPYDLKVHVCLAVEEFYVLTQLNLFYVEGDYQYCILKLWADNTWLSQDFLNADFYSCWDADPLRSSCESRVAVSLRCGSQWSCLNLFFLPICCFALLWLIRFVSLNNHSFLSSFQRCYPLWWVKILMSWIRKIHIKLWISWKECLEIIKIMAILSQTSHVLDTCTFKSNWTEQLAGYFWVIRLLWKYSNYLWVC